MATNTRVLLIAADDTDQSEYAYKWALDNLYRSKEGEEDELHLVHVIPRLHFAASYGVPPVDFVPAADNVTYEHAITKAEHFIVQRFVKNLPPGFASSPIVHIVKSEVDTESVGHVLVKKAEELGAATIVMATHSRGRVAEFFLGSVTQYVTHHSKVPVIVIPSSTPKA